MTESRVAEIMALADAYATCEFSPTTRGTDKALRARLESRIRSALSERGAHGQAIYPTHWMPLPDAPAAAPEDHRG